MATWQDEYDAGVAAYKANPAQSIRGKADVWRQGFYSESSAALRQGHTHIVAFELYVEATDKWTKSEFRTTGNAIRRYRHRLAKLGARNVSANKIVTKENRK